SGTITASNVISPGPRRALKPAASVGTWLPTISSKVSMKAPVNSASQGRAWEGESGGASERGRRAAGLGSRFEDNPGMAFGDPEQYFGCAGQHGQNQVSPKTRKFSCAYLSLHISHPRTPREGTRPTGTGIGACRPRALTRRSVS